MVEEQTLAVNHLQKDATAPLMPNPHILISDKSGWNNVHLAHSRQPTWELPEFRSLQHIIIIPTPPQTAEVEVEFFSEGHLQTVQYHPSKHIEECIEIFPANCPYKISWDSEIEFTHFYLEPEFVAHVAPESVNPDRVEILFEPKKSDPLIYQICQALKADLDRDGKGNGFYADSMATALAAHLIQHYSTRKHTLVKHEDGLSRSKLNCAIAYMNEHLGENVLLTEIAAEVGMSQYYFCRLFKRSTGMSPHEYLIQQRVERAKQLLRQPDLTITAVALDCGFANQSHFAKHFRSRTGVSPKEFRQML